MTEKEIELFGRKTFFIAPDTSLIPKSYLEEFMLLGYQTYIINDDYACPMQTKIREIISLFPQSILYFNVDASIEGIEWKSYLKELQNSVGQNILIGLFYLARSNPQEEESIKQFYSNEIRYGAGCFALSARDHNNFDSILGVLDKTNAKGRRSLVRAHCDSSSTVNFKHEGAGFSGNLLDVNLTHFRCDLNSELTNFKIFDKVRDVSLSVDGTSFVSDAVLIMRRNLNGRTLCIFMFIKRDDTPDLDVETEKVLNQKIYQIVLNENMDKLQTAFRASAK